MEIYILKNMFAVCKIPDFSRINLNRELYFAANTDEECSLVCPEKEIPADTDFSLVGIISNIASALAKEHIPIFAVSTFNTDYIKDIKVKINLFLTLPTKPSRDALG